MPKPIYNEDAKKEQGELLDAVLDEFKLKMRVELFDKISKGYMGWNEPSFEKYMAEQISNHLAKGEYIKVANLAMFLDNLQQTSP